MKGYVLLFLYIGMLCLMSCDQNDALLSTDKQPWADCPDLISFSDGQLLPDSVLWVKDCVVDTAGYDDNFVLLMQSTGSSLLLSKTIDSLSLNTLEFYLKGDKGWVELYIDQLKKGEFRVSESWTKYSIYLSPGTRNVKFISGAANIYLDVIKFDKADFSPGMPFQGGIVAYVDETGQHGLIAALKDTVDQAGWFLNNTYDATTFVGATQADYGKGNQNTEKIVTKYGDGEYAAKYCYDYVSDGYDDWYLPSKSELNYLFINRYAIGEFNYQYAYWSSYVESGGKVWYQSFGNGEQYNYMNYKYAVRPVRSF